MTGSPNYFTRRNYEYRRALWNSRKVGRLRVLGHFLNGQRLNTMGFTLPSESHMPVVVTYKAMASHFNRLTRVESTDAR